jgi:molybdopterin converting factor small subunit
VIQVVIPSGLRMFAGGAERVALTARDVRDVRGVVKELDARYPGFADRLGLRFAVAIDGEIVQDPWLEPVPAGSELHFLPPLAGGR